MIRFMILSFTAIGTIILLFWDQNEKKEEGVKRIFTSDEMVWYGLDFTKAHFVGTFDKGMGVDPADGIDLRNKWIPAWNNLIALEQQNFNLKRAFRKCCVFYDMASVNQLNRKIDPDELLNFNETRISKATIREMVKRYSGNERKRKEGIGLVFIIENFNKNSKTAGLYVTFFDIETKKVLMSEFMSGNPVGFGLRNYWAGAIKDILTWIDFYEYNKWKNKYYYNSADEETEDVLSGLQKTPEQLVGNLKTRHFE